ncbi:MAG: tetratricopeptide repeat protein [Panacagrimonas sp.]
MKSRTPLLLAAMLSAMLMSHAATAVELYTHGSEDDPRVRSSRFLGEDQRYYSAITQLLQLQRTAGSEFEAGTDYWAALAEFHLSFGMRDRAEAIYRTVAASVSDPLEAGKARLRLAEFEYERGYLDEARASLLRAREKLPDELEDKWRDLYSRVLMSQGRYNEAVTVLDEISGNDDDTAYMRFNLGVALINDGRVAPGRTALDRVGRQLGDSDNIRALRDKANVTLGWHFLQNQLGGSAKPAFARVRIEGPYSNRALLGMGWAEIAPEGVRQTRAPINSEDALQRELAPLGSLTPVGVLLRRGLLDDPYERAGIRSFRRTKGAKNEEEALRRAIALWAELIERDPQDPSVHEAWLAVPFALEQLGAHSQALTYYEQAVERLDAARRRSADAIAAIKGGRMVETIMRREPDAESGWVWELRDLPDAPETYYLQSVIADHPYAEALKNYRDVRLLSRSLGKWTDRVTAMDAASRSSTTRAMLEPTMLFAHAKRNWDPPKEALQVRLREATFLRPPLAAQKISFAPLGPIQLELSELPTKFDGPFEQLDSLKARIETLQPLLTSAAQESAKRLRTLALEELRAQKKQIEKYLVEARFALARVYDGALPDQDQDEFEVRKDGSLIREPRLPRGEFEVDKKKPLADQLTKPKPAKSSTSRKGAEEEYEVK